MRPRPPVLERRGPGRRPARPATSRRTGVLTRSATGGQGAGAGRPRRGHPQTPRRRAPGSRPRPSFDERFLRFPRRVRARARRRRRGARSAESAVPPGRADPGSRAGRQTKAEPARGQRSEGLCSQVPAKFRQGPRWRGVAGCSSRSLSRARRAARGRGAPVPWRCGRGTPRRAVRAQWRGRPGTELPARGVQPRRAPSRGPGSGVVAPVGCTSPALPPPPATGWPARTRSSVPG